MYHQYFAKFLNAVNMMVLIDEAADSSALVDAFDLNISDMGSMGGPGGDIGGPGFDKSGMGGEFPGGDRGGRGGM